MRADVSYQTSLFPAFNFSSLRSQSSKTPKVSWKKLKTLRSHSIRLSRMSPVDSAWSIYYNRGKRSEKIAIIKNPLVAMVAAICTRGRITPCTSRFHTGFGAGFAIVVVFACACFRTVVASGYFGTVVASGCFGTVLAFTRCGPTIVCISTSSTSPS
jgi:hypothetical protein